MKQTAVEWVHEKLATSQLEDMQKNINLWFKQAKEMEKQQQGYSEEDMKEAYKWGRIYDMTPFEEWFEQFKKK